MKMHYWFRKELKNKGLNVHRIRNWLLYYIKKLISSYMGNCLKRN